MSHILNRCLTAAGTSLTLYGDLVGNSSNNFAVYQVDEADPVIFPIFTTSPMSLSNQPLFTASLSPGEHIVTVALNGSQSGPPLDIDYFFITSLTQAEQEAMLSNGTSPSNTSSPTNGASSNAASHSKLLIIEVVLGSVLPVICLVALGTIVWLRRRLRRKAPDRLTVEPFPSEKSDSLMQVSLSKGHIITGAFFVHLRRMTLTETANKRFRHYQAKVSSAQ